MYDTNTPEIFAAVVSTTFAVMMIVFVVYDVMVQIRNNKLIRNAAESNAIVSNMLPTQIRDRLLSAGKGNSPRNTRNLTSYMKAPNHLKSDIRSVNDSPPLADIFLETSIIFSEYVSIKLC